MNRSHPRLAVRRALAASAIPLLISLVVAAEAPARPTAQLMVAEGAGAPGAEVVAVSGSSGDPIGGERTPPRSFSTRDWPALATASAGDPLVCPPTGVAAWAGALRTSGWLWALGPAVPGLVWLWPLLLCGTGGRTGRVD